VRRTGFYAAGTVAVMAGSLAVILAVCSLVARLGDVPFGRAWELAALPTAVSLLAIAILASIRSFRQGPSTRRENRYLRRRLDLEPEQLQQIQSRTRRAWDLLSEDRPALRLTGAYELLAIADDWCHLTQAVDQPHRASIEHQRCLDLICSYLRANRRLTRWVPGTYIEAGDEYDERRIREQLCSGLVSHLNSWHHLGPFRVDLSGADLSGMHLRHSSLAGVIARASLLTEADLTGSDLQSADLSASVATHARFSESDLRGANLVGIQANQAVFSGADLTGARLSDAHLRGAQLLGTVFERTDLSDADLRGAKLMRANLRSSLWRGADLDGADLTDAVLSPVVHSEDAPREPSTPVDFDNEVDSDRPGRLLPSPDADHCRTMSAPM
jgi:uncharacterized protein YjbI with pentapeptide repeats